MDVSGKVALVTGGGRGIGRGIVIALAENGADVAVADIGEENAGGVAAEVAGLGRRSLAPPVDVTDQASVDSAVARAIEHFGRIDILVNNAGVIGAPGWEKRSELDEKDWDLVYAVNVKGVARVSRAVAPYMKDRRYGKIVNISSVAGRLGTQTSLSYGASKAAVINLTRTMAIELAPFNVNVNAICPGLLWTPMWERIADQWTTADEKYRGLTGREAFDQAVRDRVPLGREQTPEDVGYLAAFLASDHSKNITGQAINVSGGSHLD